MKAPAGLEAASGAFVYPCVALPSLQERDAPGLGVLAGRETVEIDAPRQFRRVDLLGNARTAMQLDVGFGDAVVPGPIWTDYLELLDFGPPRLPGYALESAVEEKYQALVYLGMVNAFSCSRPPSIKRFPHRPSFTAKGITAGRTSTGP